ncbi:MAG: BamA/TamA family outer membrane protein, partial [Syntrophales bacterium]|nr:BamA/TamA family outer membrane protein [Syntrophales bacterium]
VRNMINRYRSRGYPDVRILTESETAEADGLYVRSLRFIIEEGARHRIGFVRITGAETIDERTVRGWLRGGLPEFREGRPWLAEHAESASFTITSAYIALGFLNASADTQITWRQEGEQQVADVAIAITEGARVMVSSVSFTGFQSFTEEEAREFTKLRKGMPLLSHVLETDKRTLASMISEGGRPHVQVRDHLSFSDDRSAVSVEYRAYEGPSVTLGNVYFSGNFKTRERVFRRILEMRPGDPFSPARYLQGERNLRNLDILESARFRAIGLSEKADEVTLLVDVAEKKPYYVETGLGYESQRGLYADAKAGDRNLFGTNRSAWIGSEVSETGFRNEAAMMDPRFLGYSLSATMSLYQERLELFNQTFGTDTYGTSLKLSRKLAPSVSSQLGARFEQKKLFDRGGGIPEGSEELYNSRSILVVGPSFSYDTRDFFIRPRKGMYGSFSVDFSKGIRNSFDDFLKYELDFRYFRTPLSRLTLALLGRAAFLQSFGPSGTIPEDQLLFLGGISNVRGFAENMLRYDQDSNPLGGRLSLAGSLEARIDLGRNWELTTFCDTGSVSRTLENIGSDSFRSSLGAGIRYITPIGPMGILYGHKLDRREGEGAGRWHFSIGYTF